MMIMRWWSTCVFDKSSFLNLPRLAFTSDNAFAPVDRLFDSGRASSNHWSSLTQRYQPRTRDEEVGIRFHVLSSLTAG
ncbi:hypothetical protein JG687_00017334 [Phytophthora cactorum]|uniref:Uncharacterized protein n=1 Tax=Phytophthora cactorum TaxID=29920 RepID=A0A8T1TTH7_9STRA|nr:hypothetical protein JG687_00017334 [Phytophthora cactorum]